MPGECRECGRPLVFRAPWWARPAVEPEWGYLVHCEARHFAWYPAELTEAELAEAQARFGILVGQRVP